MDQQSKVPIYHGVDSSGHGNAMHQSVASDLNLTTHQVNPPINHQVLVSGAEHLIEKPGSLIDFDEVKAVGVGSSGSAHSKHFLSTLLQRLKKQNPDSHIQVKEGK